MTEAVEMFTDGACRGNPGKGGGEVLLRFGEAEKELCGGEAFTTNNQMELMAVIMGLEALKKPCVWSSPQIPSMSCQASRNGCRTGKSGTGKLPVKNRCSMLNSGGGSTP